MLLTLANIFTISRLILIIPFLYFLQLDYPNEYGLSNFISKMVALIIFLLASLTDLLDGYLARVYKEETKIGRFLDPLADKVLIASALIAFLQLEGGIIPYWMVLLVILREFIITALRITALSHSEELETTLLAKAKTTFQVLTIIVILFFLVLKSYYYPLEGYPQDITLNTFLRLYFEDFGTFVSHTPYVLMLVTTLMTVGSGLKYLWRKQKANNRIKKKLRKYLNEGIKLVATSFYIGLIPYVPGTFGSLVAILLYFVNRDIKLLLCAIVRTFHIGSNV